MTAAAQPLPRRESASRPVHHLRTSCRACDSQRLERFLELGPQPLANSFMRDVAEFAREARYPLDLYFCVECGLVQLLDVIDPEVLFREYIYVTGTSVTMATHNERYARTLVSMLDADSHDLFVEIASNDGSLLARLQAQGVRVLGVEPARNIAAMARDRGIETVERFFDQSAAAAIVESHGLARGVIANNVLAHVDDTVGFLSACRALLAPNGMVSIEVPYAREMLERLEYDTVYHEHLCYFSVASLLRLFERAGLTIVRIDRVAVHGGSLRVYAVPDSALDTHARQVMAMAEEERHHGLASLERWRRFAADVAANRRALRDVLRALVDSGKMIAAYGAPAKGNTLLNYCGIGTETLQYVVDRNALKVGTYTPGVHLPVLPVSTLESRPPDFLLVLAWNFIDEIMTQLPEFRQRGGRFIVPIPAPSLVG